MKLFDTHNPELYRYAYRMIGDADMAEECVSGAFERFLQNLRHNGEPIRNVRAYLYRITHNLVVDHFRTVRRQVDLDSFEHLPDTQTDPPGVSSRNDDREQIRSAMQHLTHEQQIVIHLRFLEEWSHDDVAEFLGKTNEACRALQYRAIDALKKALAHDPNEINHGA